MTSSHFGHRGNTLPSVLWWVCTAAAVLVLLAGAYQLVFADRAIGLFTCALGAAWLWGTLSRRVFAFQLATVAFLMAAVALVAEVWMPSPETVRMPIGTVGPAVAVMALLGLAAGHGYLAWRLRRGP